MRYLALASRICRPPVRSSQGLGWDTDQFCTDVQKATMIMLSVLKQGGLAPGGLNFDAKVRIPIDSYA